MFLSRLRHAQGFDLLKIAPVRNLFLSKSFPYFFQVLFLLVFLVLIVLGWMVFTPEGISDRLFARTHLTMLLVWVLWWPIMIWTAVLFGRLWCAVCPLELVSNLSERLARRLGFAQFKLNRWMRTGALIVALYALLQLLIAGVTLHRIPAYTSFFLIGLLSLAIVTGFLFRDRAFCRGFCPIGLLLNAYGRGSMLAIRPRSGTTCATCTGKDCVMACNRYLPDARSCPSLLNPAKLDDNSDCLVCGQCIKSCGPDNMSLFLRRPFHAGDRRETLASWPLTLFIMLLSGFVSYEVSSEWGVAQSLFFWVPAQLHAWSGFENGYGFFRGFWMLFVYPALLWGLFGGMVALFTSDTLSHIWRRIALPMAVILAAGHMSKGLVKFSTQSVFLPQAFRDPQGIDTATRITQGALGAPEPLLSMTAASTIALILIAVAFVLAMREFRLANPDISRYYLIPKTLVASTFMFVAGGWGLWLWLGF